jgi:hypothetical protein
MTPRMTTEGCQRGEIADPDVERDRQECVALNQKATEVEREQAEFLKLTPEERLEHYRFTLATQAEQAGDLAERCITERMSHSTDQRGH